LPPAPGGFEDFGGVNYEDGLRQQIGDHYPPRADQRSCPDGFLFADVAKAGPVFPSTGDQSPLDRTITHPAFELLQLYLEVANLPTEFRHQLLSLFVLTLPTVEKRNKPILKKLPALLEDPIRIDPIFI